MTASTETELRAKRDRLRRWMPGEGAETSTGGVNHIAIFAKDLEATAEFYGRILGMPVIGVTANRDAAESTHMNVSIGNGMALSFFDFPQVARLGRKAPEGVGGIMHIAVTISTEKLAELQKRMNENRVKY